MKIKNIQWSLGIGIAVILISTAGIAAPEPVQITVDSPGGSVTAAGYGEPGIKESWEKTPHSSITFQFYKKGYVRLYSKAFLMHFACIVSLTEGEPMLQYHMIPDSCNNKPRYVAACKLDNKANDITSEKKYLCTYYPNKTYSE